MEPTINYEDAAEVCSQPWLTELEAHEKALDLKRGGWRVEWRNPPVEFGHGAGVLMVATVYHPDTWESPGDITFEFGDRPATWSIGTHRRRSTRCCAAPWTSEPAAYSRN